LQDAELLSLLGDEKEVLGLILKGRNMDATLTGIPPLERNTIGEATEDELTIGRKRSIIAILPYIRTSSINCKKKNITATR
jgi:hypothetical protein